MKKTKTTKPSKKILSKKNAITKRINLDKVINPIKKSMQFIKPEYLNKIPSFYIGLAALVITLAALVYYFRSLFIVAIVNNQPITRLRVISELEKEGGKQTLSSLVAKTLIEQEAQKKKVSVSQVEIETAIKKIETQVKNQGQNFEELLSLQGLTRETLSSQIRLQKLIEALFKPQVKVTTKEVNDYIAKNQETLGEKPNKTEIKSQLEQQKLSTLFQTWLAKAQKEAKITYFLKY